MAKNTYLNFWHIIKTEDNTSNLLRFLTINKLNRITFKKKKIEHTLFYTKLFILYIRVILKDLKTFLRVNCDLTPNDEFALNGIYFGYN